MRSNRTSAWIIRHWWLQALLIAAIASADLWIILEHDRATPVELTDALAEYRASSEAVPDPDPSVATTAVDTATAGESTTSARPSDGPATRPARHPANPPASSTTTAAGPTPHAQSIPPTGGGRPQAGVYTYTTSGGEALGPSEHSYPDETHAIVHATDCGWSFSHRVIEEHTDTYSYCSGPQHRSLVGWEATRAFLGVGLDEDYECVGDPWIPDAVGARSRLQCDTDDEDRAQLTFTRRPPERITVGSEIIDAVRVEAHAELTGNPDGTLDATLWLHPATGLRLREVRVVDAAVRAGGTSRYRERAEFVLVSLTPSA